VISTATVSLSAQTVTTDPLDFLGFRPGAPRAEVEDRVAALGGRLTCQTSRLDRRIAECTASVRPEGEPVLSVTASMIRDALGIMLLSAPVAEADLRRWVGGVASRYGPVAPRVSHGQETWQWVRRNTMLRVTTRPEARDRVASVSLVDGALLDGLNKP